MYTHDWLNQATFMHIIMLQKVYMQGYNLYNCFIRAYS